MDLLERQIVEQDDVGARVDGRLDIGKALRLDLDQHLLPGGLHPPDGFDDAARKPDVVVLDQDAVVEARPMVAAAARAHRILLERAQRRCRLARVEHDNPTVGRVDIAPRQRGDTREPLQEVERRPFGSQHQRSRAFDLGGDRTSLAAIAVAIPERDVHGGIELTERLRRHVEARQDARRLDHDRAVPADVGRHGGLRRDVAPPEVLRERATDDLTIDRRIERFERYGSHSGRPGTPSGGASSTST